MAINNAEVYDMYTKLADEYDNYKPNDEDFLSHHPDLVEEMEALDNLDPDTDKESKVAVSLLVNFLEEWFPDSIDEDDQAELRTLLDSAKELVQ